MLQFDNIAGAIHGLSHEEKLKLRLLLDEELKPNLPKNGAPPRRLLVGLLADEPELADQILESAMIACETRPFRMPSDEIGKEVALSVS